MLNNYFKNLYQRTMHEAYSLAYKEISLTLKNGGSCLDCGASDGQAFSVLQNKLELDINSYYGVEWNEIRVRDALHKGLNIIQGDLNRTLAFSNNKFDCVFGLSVLEHLLNPCHYLQECYRILNNDGNLIILTPNISTFFTAILILLGKMPSSGPHPDSNFLIKHEELFKVSSESIQPDTQINTPVHRHLIIFSYRVLQSYLKHIGFKEVKGYGFGLYPFPNFMQPFLEKIDPYHCHQMVMVAKK